MTWLWKYLTHFYVLWRTCTNNREIFFSFSEFGYFLRNLAKWVGTCTISMKREGIISAMSPLPSLDTYGPLCYMWLSFSLVLIPWVLSGFIRILWFSSPSHVQNQSFQISTQLGTMENKEPLCGCTTVKIIIIVPYLAKRGSING